MMIAAPSVVGPLNEMMTVSQFLSVVWPYAVLFISFCTLVLVAIRRFTIHD